MCSNKELKKCRSGKDCPAGEGCGLFETCTSCPADYDDHRWMLNSDKQRDCLWVPFQPNIEDPPEETRTNLSARTKSGRNTFARKSGDTREPAARPAAIFNTITCGEKKMHWNLEVVDQALALVQPHSTHSLEHHSVGCL